MAQSRVDTLRSGARARFWDFWLVEKVLLVIPAAGHVQGCIVAKSAPFPGLCQALAARARVLRMAPRCAADYLELSVNWRRITVCGMSVASRRLGVWEESEHELSELAGKTSRAGIISMMTKSTTGRNRPTCPSSTPNPQAPTCGLFSSEQHSRYVTTLTLIVGYFGLPMALVGSLCRHRGYFLAR